MKHLIPMTDFIDNVDNLVPRQIGQDFDFWIYSQFSAVQRYSKFLKQPLTLGMFVPCDENGNVLEEPINPNKIEPQPMLGQNEYNYIVSEWETYQQAKEKVLFEGFEIEGSKLVSNIGKTDLNLMRKLKIEDLAGGSVKLAESASNRFCVELVGNVYEKEDMLS